VTDVIVEPPAVSHQPSGQTLNTENRELRTENCTIRGILLRDGPPRFRRRRDHHHRNIPQWPDSLRRTTYAAGRSGEPAAVLLGEALKKLGLRGCRLKTGTPPRLDGRTIDWSKFEAQPGDADPTPFSFRTKQVAHHDTQCRATSRSPLPRRTASSAKRAPLAHVQRADSVDRPPLLPVYRRQDRQVPDKLTHQLFLEPEGLNTHEIYVNGMSTSLRLMCNWLCSSRSPGSKTRR